MAVRRRARSTGGPAELFPGFIELSEIGSGSLATVYRAREMDTGRAVALKLLNVRDVSPRALESFQRESIALGALSAHPNIVTLYRTFQTADGRPVLVLELCAGSIFDEFRQPGGLTTQRVVSVGIKMAAALETAHRAEILHRDVKPQNILITEFGEPALADFGVAMLQATSQTTSGLFDFTTLHVAPELLEGRPTSPATDVYELASSLYQLLAGQSAFRAYEGESPASVILRILRDPVRPLITDGVPMTLSDLLVASMAKDQQSRPPTAAEFAATLGQVEHAQGWLPTTFLVRDIPPRFAPGSQPLVVPAPALPRGTPGSAGGAAASVAPISHGSRPAAPVGQPAGGAAPPPRHAVPAAAAPAALVPLATAPAPLAAAAPDPAPAAPPTEPDVVPLEPPPAADFAAGLTRMCDLGHFVSGSAGFCPTCGSTTLIEGAEPSRPAGPPVGAVEATLSPGRDDAQLAQLDPDHTHVGGLLPRPRPAVVVLPEHDPWNPAVGSSGTIEPVPSRADAGNQPEPAGDTATTAVHPGRPAFAMPPRRPQAADAAQRNVPAETTAVEARATYPPRAAIPDASGLPDRGLAALPIEWGAVRTNEPLAEPSPTALRQVNLAAALAPAARVRTGLAALGGLVVLAAAVAGTLAAGLAPALVAAAGLVAAAVAGYVGYCWAVPVLIANHSSLRTRGQPGARTVRWPGVVAVEPRYQDPQHGEIVVHTQSGPMHVAASAGASNDVYQLAVRLETLRHVGR